MEVNQQDSSVLTCIEAFKQEDHDEALRLLPNLQQPAVVQTDYIVHKYNLTFTNVSLLHLAALHGWMDIVASLVCEYNCSSQCCDNRRQTPLHYAAVGGSLPVVQYLITEQHCDPLQCNNYNGGTPFLYACEAGHLEIVEYLITECKCDPASSNDGESELAINIACLGGQMNVVKYLITNQHCTPIIRGKRGRTPLHQACYKGHMKIVEYLIKELGCDPASLDNDGNLPIHIACHGGQLNVVKYLITNKYCTPDCKGQLGRTPLHKACDNGHMKIVEYLITELSCNPASTDNYGDLPIHIACLGGHLNVVKYLITNKYCTPDNKGKFGRTPLHSACNQGHMEIIEYLIKELGSDPTVVDENDMTPLHIASYFGHTDIVKWLLQDRRINVLSLDKLGRTAVDFAEFSKNSFELLKLFRPLLQSENYPIRSFTKVVLIGNSATGKSSLAQVIIKEATVGAQNHLQGDTKEMVIEVNTLTAGIESHVIRSERVGNLVLYDLAGQSEYYFSQSVMMETVMQKSPAIFINLVDLSKSEDEIVQAIHYWLTFTENVTFKTQGTSCIIMVGSHIDLLNEEQLEAKTKLVKDVVERRVKQMHYLGFVGMDCHQPNVGSTSEFFPLLTQCCDIISIDAPSVSVYCHLLYAFLQTKLNKMACQLQDLISFLAADKESPIPTEMPVLSEFLEDLSDKGLTIHLKNKRCLEKSWVVVKKEVILKDVNGVLFAPKYFRGYHSIASSTGIIPVSALEEVFPQYDTKMLVDFMVCLEFCHPVNLSSIETNLQPTSTKNASDTFLFFPSLLHAEQPQSLMIEPCSQQLCFGWCLGCMDYEYQFLTTRLLHVFLLRLAYTFSLPCENYSKTHPLHLLQRRCTVWTNGLSWNNEDGIRTIVEVIQQNRWVVVTMFHNKNTRPVEYSRHRSAVIKLVLNLKQELVPDLDTLECLISPSILQQWPLEYLPETDLFFIKDVASSVLLRKPVILSYKNGNNQLATSDALLFEPYHLLNPSSVCELMDSSKNDQPVSPALLSEVRECCQQPQLESQSYSSLREHLDEMSIFAGRNPLVLAELDLDTVISQSSVVMAGSSHPARQSSSGDNFCSTASKIQATVTNLPEVDCAVDPESFRTISQVNFDVRGLKYHMSDHGITVIIPENAVTTETQLSIGVYYVNSFQLPEGHRLVSEVFWIKTSVPLQKNAELYVPHFVTIRDEEDSNKLRYFMAPDKEVRTLTEVPANSCSFEPESSYGKLVMEHFCSGCILERIDGNGLPLCMRYLITRVFPHDSEEKRKWKADIVFSYALKSCLKVIEKQYPQDKYSLAKSSVTFPQESVTLDYEFEPVPGWFITREDGIREISKGKIDYHNLITQTSGDRAAQAYSTLLGLEKINEYPPRLSFQIARTIDAQEHLKTNVTVKGVDPLVTFEIFGRCPGTRAEPLTIDAPLEARVQHSSHLSSEHPPHLSVEKSSERHLSLAAKERDKFLRDVILALQDHLIKEWFTFGLYLDLSVNELYVLETNSLAHADKRTIVRHMLITWKDKFGQEATWDKIVDALKKIKQNSLARDLEGKYLQSAEVEETVPNPSTNRGRMIRMWWIWFVVVTAVVVAFIALLLAVIF